MWLAILGLCITLPGLLIILMALWEMTFGLMPPEQRTDPMVTILILITGAIPVVVGLRLARAGDPEIAARFVSDIRNGLRALAQPSTLRTLIRTSMGLALGIVIITVPALFIWREAAPLTALAATMVYSAADPVLNVWRRSWWMGAFISVPVWFALLGTLVAIAAVEFLHKTPRASVCRCFTYEGRVRALFCPARYGSDSSNAR